MIDFNSSILKLYLDIYSTVEYYFSLNFLDIINTILSAFERTLVLQFKQVLGTKSDFSSEAKPKVPCTLPAKTSVSNLGE